MAAPHECGSRPFIQNCRLLWLISGTSAELQAVLKCLLRYLPVPCQRCHHTQYPINRVSIIYKATQAANSLNIDSGLFALLQVQVPLGQKGNIKIATVAWRFQAGCRPVKLRLCRGSPPCNRQKVAIERHSAGIPLCIRRYTDALLEIRFRFMPPALTEAEFGQSLQYNRFQACIFGSLRLAHS